VIKAYREAVPKWVPARNAARGQLIFTKLGYKVGSQTRSFRRSIRSSRPEVDDIGELHMVISRHRIDQLAAPSAVSAIAKLRRAF
jgi:hypothetical protein